MIYLIPLFLLAALILFWIAARQRRAVGLPSGRVIYTDTTRWGKVEKPLFDPLLRLTGKPDYLLEQAGRVIPIEVKSSRISRAPHDGHIFQLAAYCLLTQRVLGKRPPYGILQYPNQTFAVDYTAQLERDLLEILTEMRQQEHIEEVSRSHASSARCQRCGFRAMCNQALK